MTGNEVKFFDLMDMANERLLARRNGNNPKNTFSDVMGLTIDLISQVKDENVIKSAFLWVPSDGRIVDVAEDLTQVSMYANETLQNLRGNDKVR